MTERLKNLTIHPQPEATGPEAGDLLSHVLSQIRLTGDRVFSVTLSGSLSGDDTLQLAPLGAYVCVVTQGALQLEQEDCEAITIDTGDLLLLPHGADVMRLCAAGGDATVVACRFWFDPDSLRGMALALPAHIHITKAEGQGWVDGIAHFLLIEAGDNQPGAALMISRLIDLVVIRALRTWVQRGQTSGWLGGLSDARIARALMAIHENPGQIWDNKALAQIAAMSRSSFCERFAALVGRSPLRYQNEWRLMLARDSLSQRKARVGEIGLSIGYESEAAFSRAYKAFFGHSPRAEYGAQGRL